jgi:hypothetical protein
MSYDNKFMCRLQPIILRIPSILAIKEEAGYLSSIAIDSILTFSKGSLTIFIYSKG